MKSCNRGALHSNPYLCLLIIMTGDPYIFKSRRLGFRKWNSSDLPVLSAINSDPKVMKFFPSIQSAVHTEEFMSRMNTQLDDRGYCYFAADRLDEQELIGFIGLMDKDFKSDFTPCTDIGWRIAVKHWNKGFATEGAVACLDYAFNKLNIGKIVSIAPRINHKSQHIMKKIGMKYVSEFTHPQIATDERLRDCVLYEVTNPEHS